MSNNRFTWPGLQELKARQFSVTGVADPEERHVELVLVCVEVVL